MPTSDLQSRQRAHVERMLARAERRSRQAAKLVEKWKGRLADLDREGIAAKQAKLWSDDGFSAAHPGSEAMDLTLARARAWNAESASHKPTAPANSIDPKVFNEASAMQNFTRLNTELIDDDSNK